MAKIEEVRPEMRVPGIAKTCPYPMVYIGDRMMAIPVPRPERSGGIINSFIEL
jgi:hypothetical protein